MEYYPKPNILYENLIPEQQVYKAFKHLPYLEFKEQAGTASLSTQYTTPPCTCLTSHVEALVTTITSHNDHSRRWRASGGPQAPGHCPSESGNRMSDKGCSLEQLPTSSQPTNTRSEGPITAYSCPRALHKH